VDFMLQPKLRYTLPMITVVGCKTNEGLKPGTLLQQKGVSLH
jgi:hypothetical protein